MFVLTTFISLALPSLTKGRTYNWRSICGTASFNGGFNQSHIRPLPSRLPTSELEEAWNKWEFPGDLQTRGISNVCWQATGRGLKCGSHRDWDKLGLGRVPLFIKNHKVGGTTFATALATHLFRLARRKGNISLTECADRWTEEGKKNFPRKQACDFIRIQSHYAKDIFRYCGMVPANSVCAGRTNQVSVTLFRKPIPRWLSMYFYNIEFMHSGPEKDKLLNRTKEIGVYNAFLEWVRQTQTDINIEPYFYHSYKNHCEQYGGCPKLTCSKYGGCPGQLAKYQIDWKRQIMARIALSNIQEIGITELFDESLVMMALSLGWGPGAVAYANQKRERVSLLHTKYPESKMPANVRATLEAMPAFQRETALYEFALQLHKETKEFWGEQCLGMAMERFNKKKEQLSAAIKGKLRYQWTVGDDET